MAEMRFQLVNNGAGEAYKVGPYSSARTWVAGCTENAKSRIARVHKIIHEHRQLFCNETFHNGSFLEIECNVNGQRCNLNNQEPHAPVTPECGVESSTRCKADGPLCKARPLGTEIMC